MDVLARVYRFDNKKSPRVLRLDKRRTRMHPDHYEKAFELCVRCLLALAVSVAQAQPSLSASASAPRFKVLALAEAGGHHVEFTKAVKPWLRKCGEENGFEVVLQLDFVPYGWKPEAMAAFKVYTCLSPAEMGFCPHIAWAGHFG
jgi:hypothetical protein